MKKEVAICNHRPLTPVFSPFISVGDIQVVDIRCSVIEKGMDTVNLSAEFTSCGSFDVRV